MVKLWVGDGSWVGWSISDEFEKKFRSFHPLSRVQKFVDVFGKKICAADLKIVFVLNGEPRATKQV